eukprot:6165838-Prymnesium_polylepis.1
MRLAYEGRVRLPREGRVRYEGRVRAIMSRGGPVHSSRLARQNQAECMARFRVPVVKRAGGFVQS